MYLIFSDDDAHDGQWLNFQLTVVLCIVNRFTRCPGFIKFSSFQTSATSFPSAAQQLQQNTL